MKKLYIISGCNGAGKTTASYTILPEILNCKEFVNADEIARGLSPFKPEGANILAGRVMLERIKYLLKNGEDFAFETTLATKSYTHFIKEAKNLGYSVSLLFFWLNSTELAINRVKLRVAEGGHNIPEDVIRRRYHNGLKNFFNLYQSIVDQWMLIDNSGTPYELIVEAKSEFTNVINFKTWGKLKSLYYGK